MYSKGLNKQVLNVAIGVLRCYAGDPDSFSTDAGECLTPQFLGVKLVPAPCGRIGAVPALHGMYRNALSYHHEVMADLGEYSHQGWVSSQV